MSRGCQPWFLCAVPKNCNSTHRSRNRDCAGPHLKGWRATNTRRHETMPPPPPLDIDALINAPASALSHPPAPDRAGGHHDGDDRSIVVSNVLGPGRSRTRRAIFAVSLLIVCLTAAVGPNGLFNGGVDGGDGRVFDSNAPFAWGGGGGRKKAKTAGKYSRVKYAPVVDREEAESPAHETMHQASFRKQQQQTQRRKRAKKKRKLPFPVVFEDDEVPSLNVAITAAADALDCRESVIAFVINATDVKDECEGLKRAFDKTCSSQVPATPAASADDKAKGAGSRRRRLVVAERRRDMWDWANRAVWGLHKLYRQYTRDPDFSFLEDEILDNYAWSEAKDLVAQNLDCTAEYVGRARKMAVKRKIQEAPGRVDQDEPGGTAAKAEADAVEASEDGAQAAEDNRSPSAEEEPHKPALLTIPTANEHVTDQMLNDALLLQEGGSNEKIVSAIQSATNATNATKVAVKAAAVDAVVSSKAVSDATAAVSAVLNDPQSVEARTCCASILNVYHEHCDRPEGEQMSDTRLIIIVFAIAFCGMVKSLIRHFGIRWLPEAAGCILVGVAGGLILTFIPHSDFSFDGEMFLRIMVPPIVFEAALSIDKKSFNRHIIPIMFYAVLGTLFSTALTALLVHQGTTLLGSFCSPIPFIESLIFGALISSIDPIAVLSVLSNMGMTDTDTIYVVIFGESLLNDGVAIVLFETLVHFLDESLVIDNATISAAVIHFFVVALGSLAVGVLSGICCTTYYWAMHGCHTPLVEVLMFFCWAFIPYYICDGVGWSGIVAVVATGVIMDLYVRGQKGFHESNAAAPDLSDIETFVNANGASSSPQRFRTRDRRAVRKIFSMEGHLSTKALTHVGFVTEINATMMETAIFAYLGLFLFSSRYHWNHWHAWTAIVACVASRAAMVPFLSAIANWTSQLVAKRSRARSPSLNKLASSRQLCGELCPEAPREAIVVDRKMQYVLLFAGLRGAMSFALVENIPLFDTVTGTGSRFKPELKAMTSACIVFTVFILGGSTFYLMELLGMAPNGKAADPGLIEITAPLVRKTSRKAMSSAENSPKLGGKLGGTKNGNGIRKDLERLPDALERIVRQRNPGTSSNASVANGSVALSI